METGSSENNERKMRVEFVYHPALGSTKTKSLYVGVTETIKEVKLRLTEWLGENRLCLTQGHTFIDENSTFHSERGTCRSPYYVHVLPPGNFRSCMVTSYAKRSKKEERLLVIVPEDCSVGEFRAQVARQLQKPEGTLRLHTRKGFANPKESKESVLFFQNPIQVREYQSGMIQVWEQRMLNDCPEAVKHVYVESKNVRCTVIATVQKNTAEKDEHRSEIFKYDNFTSIQKIIGAEHNVDFRLVQLTAKSGKPVHRDDSVCKYGWKRTHEIDATICSKGRVVHIEHVDVLFKDTCAIKEADLVTVGEVRKAIELYHKIPHGTLELALRDLFLSEERPISSFHIDSSEELTVHSCVKRQQTSCSPRDQGETPPTRSERKRPGVAEDRTAKKNRTAQDEEKAHEIPSSETRDTRSRSRAQETPASNVQQFSEIHHDENIVRDSHNDENNAVVQRVRGVLDASSGESLEQSVPAPQGTTSTALVSSADSYNPFNPVLRNLTNLPVPQMSNHQEVHNWNCADVEGVITTKAYQKGGQTVAHALTAIAINSAYANDPNVSRFFSASEHQASPALSALEDPPGVIKDAVLRKIAEKLSHDWPSLCLSLGVHADVITRIQHDTKLLLDQAFEGLRQWKKTKGREATLSELKKALKKNELNLIADMLHDEAEEK